MPWGVNNLEDALLALSNFKQELLELSTQANGGYNHGEITGAGPDFLYTVEEARAVYGDIIVAVALEKTRSRIDLHDLVLYYIAPEGSPVWEYQRRSAEDFDRWHHEFIKAIEEEIEEESVAEPEPDDYWDPWEDEDVGPEPEPTPEPPKHKTREELEKEYKKARRRLAEQIRRRRAAGVDVKYELPDIPKRITEGSIRKIEKIISKIQDEYRYLRGRGYRGMRR